MNVNLELRIPYMPHWQWEVISYVLPLRLTDWDGYGCVISYFTFDCFRLSSSEVVYTVPLQGDLKSLHALAVCQNGKTIVASCTNHNLCLLDAKTGKKMSIIHNHFSKATNATVGLCGNLCTKMNVIISDHVI